MKISSSKLSEFFANPTAYKSVLFYGNDQSRINLYSQKILCALNADGASSITRIECQNGEKDLEQFFLSATTVPMFHKRSLIFLSDANDTLCATLKQMMQNIHPNHCYVVLQAQELTKHSALKAYYENDEQLASLGCYKENDVAHIVHEFLAEHDITCDKSAFKMLCFSLQNSAACIEPELKKLLLYLGTEKELRAEDISSSMSLDLDPALDDICNAVAEGDLQNFVESSDKLFQRKTSPILIIRSSMKYFITLEHLIRKTKTGLSVDAAIKSMRPPIFFKLIPQFTKHTKAVKYSTVCMIIRYLFDLEARLKSPDMSSQQEIIFNHLMYSLIMRTKSNSAQIV